MGREDSLDRMMSLELVDEKAGYDPYNCNGPRQAKKREQENKVLHDFDDSQYLRSFWGMRV